MVKGYIGHGLGGGQAAVKGFRGPGPRWSALPSPGSVLRDGQACWLFIGRCGVGVEGLAHSDRLQSAEDVGDVLVVLSEELFDEDDDGSGDALRRFRPGLRSDFQGSHQAAAEGFQGEDVLARFAPVPGQRGDGDDDPRRGVDEQLRHPQLGGGEPAGGFGVVGVDRAEVAEHADRGCGVIGASGTVTVSSDMTAPLCSGRPVGRGGLEDPLGPTPCGQSPAVDGGELSPFLLITMSSRRSGFAGRASHEGPDPDL